MSALPKPGPKCAMGCGADSWKFGVCQPCLHRHGLPPNGGVPKKPRAAKRVPSSDLPDAIDVAYERERMERERLRGRDDFGPVRSVTAEKKS